jgi:hypothetical protein
MRLLLIEATDGLTDAPRMTVDSAIPFFEIKTVERPLFLAHYCGVYGEQLYTTESFDKWEYSGGRTLNPGATCHPGSFGGAIGWEVRLRPSASSISPPQSFRSLSTL